MTLNITKPTVNSDGGTWGAKVNTALDAIVAYINAQPDPTAAAQDVVSALNLGDVATHAAADFALAGDLSNLATLVADKASTADVTAAISALVGAAPSALDTLYELATQMQTDESAASTLATLVGTKYTKPGTGIPQTDLDSATSTKINAGSTAQAAAIAAAATDATTKANAAQAAAVQRANHTGTQSADTLTDGTTNKAFLATERTKLAGIAANAIDKPTAQGIALVQTLIWS